MMFVGREIFQGINVIMMIRDYGAGLSVDELIGLPAWHIHQLPLPPDEIFNIAKRGARLLIEINHESYILTELWEDGHSVWHNLNEEKPLVVTPTGQIIRSQR